MSVDHDLRRSATHVFVSPADLDAGRSIPIDDETAHHLSRVLRLRDGEQVSVSDGAGRWRMTEVADARGTCRLDAIGEVVTDAAGRDELVVATAIPKGDRVDWLVQKSTELGADRLILLHAERSVVRWKPERATKQLLRLRRVSLEASRQSRRTRLLQIEGPVDALDVLPKAVAAEPGGRSLVRTDNFVAIGPEGGWSTSELDSARDQVELGPNVLRVETAVLAAIALCAFERH